jgi:NAD-dependent dihydropyrimidine dehydrogenase PreA subunit
MGTEFRDLKTYYLKDVVTLKLYEDKCTGYGMCLEVCPHAVLILKDKKARIIDRDACMECGACAQNCPFGAITVKAGVGCAEALIRSFLQGGEPACGCAEKKSKSCCC